VIPGRVSARRPDDLLVFDATFGGFVLKADPPRLERSASDAHIVVEFPPQSFGEEAFLETANQKFTAPNPLSKRRRSRTIRDTRKRTSRGRREPIPPLPAARLRMSGPSRVGVTMPPELTTIGYDLASILAALRDWPMRLDRTPCRIPRFGWTQFSKPSSLPVSKTWWLTRWRRHREPVPRLLRLLLQARSARSHRRSRLTRSRRSLRWLRFS